MIEPLNIKPHSPKKLDTPAMQELFEGRVYFVQFKPEIAVWEQFQGGKNLRKYSIS